MRIDLRDALKMLDERTRDIVMSRFLDEPKSFDELGRRHHLSREAVRQIYLDAMERIKSYCGGTN